MDVIEKMARAICLSTHEGADADFVVAGDILGNVTREWQLFVPQARAALTALAENVSDEIAEAFWRSYWSEWKVDAPYDDATRRALSAAIRAAANPTGEV